jgi:hypothetical protein
VGIALNLLFSSLRVRSRRGSLRSRGEGGGGLGDGHIFSKGAVENSIFSICNKLLFVTFRRRSGRLEILRIRKQLRALSKRNHRRRRLQKGNPIQGRRNKSHGAKMAA